ncbi:ABC transporter substrate-binding protein [Nocardioides terrisoli]|uniref:ABC transporter substrate-binding protein n=1 Tax=Nocardioides terrisoli TaxID=3388267 RepID=UPI00287BA97B|nr:ABC transporter substrate-binding protein [Nocardioides marmorisolisilvae]
MRRGTIAAVVALTAALMLSGCGSSSLNDTGQHKSTVTSSVNKAAAAMVPKAIKDKGTLVVGSDASYAPSEFLAGDGTTVEGFDVDLFNAVAKTLGLKATYQNAKFGSIISGVNSGKFDIGVSSFSIDADREKSATMVSYFSAGTLWAVASGNPKKIDPTKPCGIRVAVQSSTTQSLDQLPPLVKACQKAGKPTHVDSYDQQNQATAAVVSGKDDAMLADSPVIAYAVKQSKGKLEAVGSIFASAPYGYVLPKSETDFGKAIVAALKVLQSNGEYEKILKSWGVEQGAISDFVVNPPATS